jgi:CRISPR/Cas system-associated exonuclease Cas4 (RecB family)
MIAAAPPVWRELEWEFGGEGREVAVEAGGVEIRLQGKIDRVDEVAPGVLRVIDYKSGSPRRYREAAPFDGGRRIQHWVYQLAAEQVLGARETSMEYHFPTVNGERRAVSYPQDRLRMGDRVLGELVTLATGGRFIATDRADDCAFCDFAAICRVVTNDYGGATCGAAAWSKNQGMGLAEFAPLRTLREIDERDD